MSVHRRNLTSTSDGPAKRGETRILHLYGDISGLSRITLLKIVGITSGSQEVLPPFCASCQQFPLRHHGWLIWSGGHVCGLIKENSAITGYAPWLDSTPPHVLPQVLPPLSKLLGVITPIRSME